MRIRKNMKLSSMLLATAGYGGDKLETYVCPLNQSPWDVIPLTSSFEDDDGAAELTNLIDSSWFLPSPSSSSPSLTHQFAGEEDNFNGNVSLGDSSGAAQRFNGSVGNNHSLVSDERLHLIASERSPDVESSMDRSDGGSGKKSYPVEPHSPIKTSGDNYQAAVSVPAPPKRGRPRGSGKKAQAPSSTATAASNNNPYQFYYYSGFGPRWGRKRGGDEKIVLTDNKNGGCEDNKKSNSSGEESYKTAAFEHGSSSFDGFEFMEEDYDDVVDQSIGHGKKLKSTTKKMKRGRKPVKERSLKSLM